MRPAPVMDFKAFYEQNPNRNRVILHSDANCFYASVEFPFRSICVHCDNLVPDDMPVQIDLFGDYHRRERAERIERTIDNLTERFGKSIIHRGVVYTDKVFTRINPADDHVGPAT